MSKKLKIAGCTVITGIELDSLRRESRKLKSLDPICVIIEPDKFWGMAIHRRGGTPEIAGFYMTLMFGCDGTSEFWCYRGGSEHVDHHHLPNINQVYKATTKWLKLYKEKGNYV